MPDTEPDAPDGPPAAPPVLCYLDTDAAGVVVSATRSNAAQARPDGTPYTEVGEDVFASARTRVGRCRLVDGALQDYAPPPSPPPTPVVTSKQVLYALNHLGVRPQWDTAWTAQKQDDRDWFGLGGDPFPITHKRIIRMLATAGSDAGEVLAQAQAE